MRASNRQERVAVLRLAPWIAAAVAAGSRPVRWIGAVAELLPVEAETASAIEMFQDPQAPQIAVRSVALRVARVGEMLVPAVREAPPVWEVPAAAVVERWRRERRRREKEVKHIMTKDKQHEIEDMDENQSGVALFSVGVVALSCALAIVSHAQAQSQENAPVPSQPAQKAFDTPQQAVEALIQAADRL